MWETNRRWTKYEVCETKVQYSNQYKTIVLQIEVHLWSLWETNKSFFFKLWHEAKIEVKQIKHNECTSKIQQNKDM